MNSLKTAELIRLVSKHPILYDSRSEDYGDVHKRDVIWQQISKELGLRADVCRAKWNILRGGYRRALRNKESGYAYSSRKWRFEDDLSFLKDCVMERRRTALRQRKAMKNEEMLGMMGSDHEDEITVVKEEPTEIIYEQIDEVAQDDKWPMEYLNQDYSSNHETEKNQNRGDEPDALIQFFLSMAALTKTFPPLLQAQVKAKVFHCVNSAEIEFLKEKCNSDAHGCDQTEDSALK